MALIYFAGNYVGWVLVRAAPNASSNVISNWVTADGGQSNLTHDLDLADNYIGLGHTNERYMLGSHAQHEQTFTFVWMVEASKHIDFLNLRFYDVFFPTEVNVCCRLTFSSEISCCHYSSYERPGQWNVNTQYILGRGEEVISNYLKK